MKEVFIVSCVRTAVGKASTGKLRAVRTDDLAALVIQELLKRCPNVPAAQIEDVILGCAMPEGAQGYNLARIAAQRANLPDCVPGVTVNRLCASGLEAIGIGAQRIASEMADLILCGGAESMSQVPMFGYRTTFNPCLVESIPDTYLSMGLTAENVSRRYEVTRETQDEFAYQSHQKAIAAIKEGRFKEECVPVLVREVNYTDGRRQVKEFVFETDEGPRPDTSMEKLRKLKPAFHPHGSVTAGNSSQRSDGAAIVLLASEEKMRELHLKPLAKFLTYAVGGVPAGLMGMGPVSAIPKALKQARLELENIDLIELNEAFAAQSLAVIRELKLPVEKINVNGGAIALGHPLGATGARLTVSILNELRRRNGRYGLVSMCVGGGMGGAGIVELLN